MTLKPDFQFSQSSLQDYVDCQRRFELRYIDRRLWPALQSEPVLEQERHMQQGHRFHQMAHQYLLGIPANYNRLAAADPELEVWWDHFIHSKILDQIPGKRLPEFSLSSQMVGFRIVAKYDLLALEPGSRIVILDWKTGRGRTKARTLKQRMQTRLYPFLLVSSGAYLNGGIPIAPEQVEMIYWFASFPDQPQVFSYNQADYEADCIFLQNLVMEISARQPGQFLMAGEEKGCLFCVYRSFCGRGDKAGDWSTLEEDFEDEPGGPLDIDLDQIGAIAF